MHQHCIILKPHYQPKATVTDFRRCGAHPLRPVAPLMSKSRQQILYIFRQPMSTGYDSAGTSASHHGTAPFILQWNCKLLHITAIWLLSRHRADYDRWPSDRDPVWCTRRICLGGTLWSRHFWRSTLSIKLSLNVWQLWHLFHMAPRQRERLSMQRRFLSGRRWTCVCVCVWTFMTTWWQRARWRQEEPTELDSEALHMERGNTKIHV